LTMADSTPLSPMRATHTFFLFKKTSKPRIGVRF
jgi:hypothetical protein